MNAEEIREELANLKALEKQKKAELKALTPPTPTEEWLQANKKLATHVGRSTMGGLKAMAQGMGNGIGWLGEKITPKGKPEEDHPGDLVEEASPPRA